MLHRSETILLLEHVPLSTSVCASALETLGYERVCYAQFTPDGEVTPTAEEIDAVVAVWTDYDIDRYVVLDMIASATSLPHARGALVISPFSTAENAELFKQSGARAWLRYPFQASQFDQRLRYLFHGDRRERFLTVPHDQRRDPIYPVAA